MTEIRAAIFDADGVLILPPENFSTVYAREHGLDISTFGAFFAGPFQSALAGQADVKDLLRESPIWQLKTDPQEVLDEWFAHENRPNHELLDLVRKLRHGGLPVYMATSQERNRAQYLRNVMFPGLFDYMFISCEMGCVKTTDEYWKKVLDRLAKEIPGIKPSEIIYFDDSRSHLEPAARAGIQAHLYTSVDQVRDLLVAPALK